MAEENTGTSSSDEKQTVSDEEEVVVETTEDSSGDVPRKRTAEARINELVGEIKELREKLESKDEEVESKIPAPTSPAPSAPTQLSPEAENAINILKERGFVTKEEIDSRIEEVKNRQVLDTEHMKLEGKYSGSDGRPAYDKSKIETFMRKRGIYDPEAAYKIMNEDELLDWQLKQSEGTVKKGLTVEKGGSTAGAVADKNTITAAMIAEKMQTPEGRAWYEKNRDKILTLVAKGQL